MQNSQKPQTSATLSGMTVSTPDTEPDASRFAFGALILFTLLVAVVTFVLSFHGLDDYGTVVAKLGDLSWLVPLGVDGLTLVAVAATYLLRHAPWRVRAYAWFVFTVAIAASVAGNLSHAAARHLPRDGMVGAAAWPLLLALASHLVILTKRWVDRLQTPGPVAVTDAVADTESAPELPEQPADPRPFDPQAYARRRAGQGHKVAAIGRALRERGQDVSDRQVARWTEDLRAARTAPGTPAPEPVEPVAEPATT